LETKEKIKVSDENEELDDSQYQLASKKMKDILRDKPA